MASSTSSSASTAASTERATSEGREEVVEEVKVSPFDRLPDEVVAKILQPVVRKALRQRDYSKPLISKRLFALSDPYWLSLWSPRAEDVPPLFFRPEACLLVRSLKYTPAGRILEPFDWEVLALTAFANLTSFKLCGTVWEGRVRIVALPKTFSRLLEQLQHLLSLSLELDDDFTFVDTEFSVGQSLPQLQQLILGCACTTECAKQLLKDSAPNLKRLEVWTEHAVDVYPLLPWSSLTHLSISLSLNWPEWPLMLAGSLRAALYPEQGSSDLPSALPLRELQFRGWDSHHKTPPCFDQFRAFLELLSLTRVGRLLLPGDMPWCDFDDVPVLNAVESLDFWFFRLADKDSIEEQGPFRILAALPRLRFLHLEYLSLEDPSLPVSDRLSPSTDLVLRHPAFTSFLDSLTSTSVLRLDWIVDNETYRWTRSRATEEFEVERFRPY
ncbi:hypothetical protein JCM8097_005603 [Rhodosporidiobolus ruineniae]